MVSWRICESVYLTSASRCSHLSMVPWDRGSGVESQCSGQSWSLGESTICADMGGCCPALCSDPVCRRTMERERPRRRTVLFRSRKCRACGERSHREDWWSTSRPVESSAGMEGIAGTSTFNVDTYGWTRGTYASRSVVITCPKCGAEATVRDRRTQRFW